MGRFRCQREGTRSGEELQLLHRRLVGSLEELLALGSQRLEQRPQLDVRDIVELQQQYYNHTVSIAKPGPVVSVGIAPRKCKLKTLGSMVLQKFFHFLSHHSKMLRYLTERLPQSALTRWREVVAGLQEEAEQVLQRGMEDGVRMQETLQVRKPVGSLVRDTSSNKVNNLGSI